MLNQLLKLGVFVTLGLWLKHRLKGLLLLIAVLFIAWLGHSEYLAYVKTSGNAQWLELSYLAKWGVFFFAIALYYLMVERGIGRAVEENRNTIKQTDVAPNKGDGFDFLRSKKTLESEADKALNQKRGIERQG